MNEDEGPQARVWKALGYFTRARFPKLWYAYCDYYWDKYGCYPFSERAVEERLHWF